MAAILCTRLCGRNTSRLVFNVGRPILASCSVNGFPNLERKNALLSSVIHTSAAKQQHYEIAPPKGSHHWLAERFVSVALLALIPAGYFYPGAAVDWGLALAIPFHNHWGMHNILKDYAYHINKKLPKPANIIWLCLTLIQLGGLCYFNYNDVGICKAAEMLWRL